MSTKDELDWHVEQGGARIETEYDDSFFKDSFFFEKKEEDESPLFQVKQDDSLLGIWPLVVVSIIVACILAFAIASGVLGLVDLLFMAIAGLFIFLIQFSIMAYAENGRLKKQNKYLNGLVDKYYSRF